MMDYINCLIHTPTIIKNRNKTVFDIQFARILEGGPLCVCLCVYRQEYPTVLLSYGIGKQSIGLHFNTKNVTNA